MFQSLKICIIGSGVVGKSTGIGFCMHGNDVIFCDKDEKKLKALSKKGYQVTRKISEAINDSCISFICIQTPTINGKIDFSHLREAIINVAEALSEKTGYHVIAIRSTIVPYTTQSMLIPLLEKHSKLNAGEDFGVCMNPEFLRKASALKDFLNPHRIVIGELDKRSGDSLEKLYSSFKAPIFRTGLASAEMIKYVANLFLACKISFFNEAHIICRELGLEPKSIAEIVSLDPRIGGYGIYGGKPFGGSCLPKDLEAFIEYVESRNLNPKLLHAVRDINKKIAKKRTKINMPRRDELLSLAT